MTVDLLKNCNPLGMYLRTPSSCLRRHFPAKLGPFDGRVAARVTISGADCFVTTNADYIPEIPPDPSMIVLRKDMRYGTDDHARWPQKYSLKYCHFGAIPRAPTASEGQPALKVMYWDPTPADFVCPESGRTITRGFGKLSSEQFSRLSLPVNTLLERYEKLAENHKVPLFKSVVQNLRLGLERLQTLPSTYTQMVLGVTNVQRSYLELAGVIAYMLIHKPRMETPAVISPAAPAPDDRLPEHRVGVFTSNPIIAQQFYAANLPYWLIRPMSAFKDENILALFTPISASSVLELAPAPGFAPSPAGDKDNIDDKLHSLDICTRSTPWYIDPFKKEVAQQNAMMIAGPSAEMAQQQPPTPTAGRSRGGQNRAVPGSSGKSFITIGARYSLFG